MDLCISLPQRFNNHAMETCVDYPVTQRFPSLSAQSVRDERVSHKTRGCDLCLTGQNYNMVINVTCEQVDSTNTVLFIKIDNYIKTVQIFSNDKGLACN